MPIPSRIPGTALPLACAGGEGARVAMNNAATTNRIQEFMVSSPKLAVTILRYRGT
jgi:hypothetical protein